MIDVEKTIISQYGNSAAITQLIAGMNAYIDPRADIDNFFNFVWNVDTAQGFGLDIWGAIVNVGRDVTIPEVLTYFGFSEAGDAEPFGQQSFFNSTASSNTYRLGDDVYRVLILSKALANISDSTAASLNRLLQNLFPGRGRAYVLDSGGMKIQYTFEFLLEPFEYSVLTQSEVIPNPAGVGSVILQVDVGSTFGFMEAGGQPFGQGVFFI
jgi:hypothetical protein